MVTRSRDSIHIDFVRNVHFSVLLQCIVKYNMVCAFALFKDQLLPDI